MKYFDAPVPGGKISAENLKNIYDEVRRSENFTVEGATLHKGVGGSQLNIEQKKEFWGRITDVGTGGRYSWEQVEPNASGTGWLTSESQAKGSYTYNPAIEAGLSTSVAVGTIVRLSGPFLGYAVSDNTPEFYVFQSGGLSNARLIRIKNPISPLRFAFECVELITYTGGSWSTVGASWVEGGTTYTAYHMNYNNFSNEATNSLKVSNVPSTEYYGTSFYNRQFIAYMVNGFFVFWSDEADPPAQLTATVVGSVETVTAGGIKMQPAYQSVINYPNPSAFNTISSNPIYLMNPNQDGDFTLNRKYVAVKIGYRQVNGGYWWSGYANKPLPVYAAHPFGSSGLLTSPTPTGPTPILTSP